MKKKLLYLALLITCIFAILLSSCSRILIVDPPFNDFQPIPITTPHDLVVAHDGCGTTDRNSLEAYLYEDDTVIDEITDVFQYNSQRDAWIAEGYNLPEGQIRFGASAHSSTGDFCYAITTGQIFPLEVTSSLIPDVEYKSILHHEDDEDFFTIKAPGSNFGSWFEITVEAVEPSDYGLFVKLLGPLDSYLDSTEQPSTKFWIALKSGVEAKIMIKKGDLWPEDQKFITYKISVASNEIYDNFEPDDEEAKATLSKNESQTALMCAVLDNEENCAGFPDWFKYEHEECKNDCISLTMEAEIQICEQLGGDCCHNQSEINENETQWMKKMCMSQETELDKCRGIAEESGTRYVSIRHVEEYFGDYRCHGQGEVPTWYKNPYRITWTEEDDVPWPCPE